MPSPDAKARDGRRSTPGVPGPGGGPPPPPPPGESAKDEPALASAGVPGGSAPTAATCSGLATTYGVPGAGDAGPRAGQSPPAGAASPAAGCDAAAAPNGLPAIAPTACGE